MRHPGASTVANQLLDGDHYHSLGNLGNPVMSPHTEGRKQQTRHTNKTTGKRGSDRRGETASEEPLHLLTKKLTKSKHATMTVKTNDQKQADQE